MALLCEDLSELYSYFNQFRLDGQFYDVIIKVGAQSFHCHRIILASALEYFRTMFSGNFSESEKKEIELMGINASDFELLLTHIYGKRIEIKEDNVSRLLRISHYLGPQSLETAIVRYISESNSIPLNTVLSIFMFACKTKKIELVDKLMPSIAENFVTVSKYVKSYHIPGNILQQIISHPKLDKDSTAMLDFLGRWVKRQGEEGKKFLPDLLTAVSLSEMPLEWIVKTLTNHQAHGDDDDCDEENEKSGERAEVNGVGDLEQFSLGVDIAGELEIGIDESSPPFLLFTLDLQMSAESINIPVANTYEFIRSRGKYDVQFVETGRWNIEENFIQVYCKSVFVDELRFTILCVDIPPKTSTTQQYNYSTGAYEMITEPKKYTFHPYVCYGSPKSFKTYELINVANLENVAVVATGTNIYLYNDAEFTMYNTQRDEWVSISNSDYTRTISPNLISYENCLYLIGGKSLSTEAATLTFTQTDGKLFQRFDPREGKWCQLRTMKYAHYKSASCTYKNMLYVSGGDDLAHFKGYIEHYNFKAGKWNVYEASMPEPKMNHTLLADNDQLWFFGGQTYNSEKAVSNICSWYVYDMKEENWSGISHMPKSYGKFKTQQILDVVIKM